MCLLPHGHGGARREEIEGIVVEGDAVGEVSLEGLHQVQNAVVRHHRHIKHAVVSTVAQLAADAREKVILFRLQTPNLVHNFLFEDSTGCPWWSETTFC